MTDDDVLRTLVEVDEIVVVDFNFRKTRVRRACVVIDDAIGSNMSHVVEPDNHIEALPPAGIRLCQESVAVCSRVVSDDVALVKIMLHWSRQSAICDRLRLDEIDVAI